MKRREFIKTSAVCGTSGLLTGGCASRARDAVNVGPGFDVHPFVKNHPEAVFVHRTSVSSIRDTEGKRTAGEKLAKELIVPTRTGGYPLSTRIVIKPNWTGAHPMDGKPVFEKLGINTDPDFIAGWAHGMKKAATGDYYVRESGSPHYWEDMGYYRCAGESGFNLRDMSLMDMWELDKDRDLVFIDIPDGVVFKTAAYMAPVNEPGTFLVNIAKFKAHGMGITSSVKNLQGLCPKVFKQFCTAYDKVRTSYDRRYHKYFNRGFERHIEALHARHVKEGIPRWDRPGDQGGIWMEQWCQRMLDSYTVTHPGISMVEGIYGQDGNGFGIGPHEPLGKYGVTSRDYLSNVVIFGMDPFRVDIVTHWLAGQEPGNFGLFHIGIERGFSDVLDPRDIPVYRWEEGRATPSKLDGLERTPLVTYYLQRDYNGQKEPRFHLCDEPFDYSAWKRGERSGDLSPSIRGLGTDGGGLVLEITAPEPGNAYVDVLNSSGEVLWRLYADGLEPGVHQVVWDGFASPGLYSFYVRGMGWDAVRQEAIYT